MPPSSDLRPPEPLDARGPVVLFDGDCTLCNASVRFAARRDRHGRLRFAPLGSPEAIELLASLGYGPPRHDTMLCVEGGRVHERSAAAIRVARHLRFPWPMACVFLAVPRPIRDGVYAWIARHRHVWVGRDGCEMKGRPPNERA